MTLLNVSELGVLFPVSGGRKLRAVHDVSFRLRRGESIALVGESGSGKSTIARIITRLVTTAHGTVQLDGEDLLTGRRQPSRDVRKRIQMVFQDPFAAMNPVHTVRHHIARPLRIHGHFAPGAVEALLEQVGLRPGADFADRHPSALSGGQLQRVAIARALAVDPELIIADEPTSMLDVSARVEILQLLKGLQSQGRALIFITHDLAAARFIADRILVLYAGQVMEAGPAEDLIQTPLHPYTRLLMAAAPRPGGSVFAPLPGKPGLPPTIDPPPGCPFQARCPDAQAICSTPPPNQPQGENHLVRCHLYTEENGDEAIS